MKKRIISILLAVCLAFALTAPALAAVSLTNFTRTRTYQDTFTDVSPGAWYYDYVRAAYEHGLISGRTPREFVPGGKITIAEAIALAATMHSIYHNIPARFQRERGFPWYDAYVSYAIWHGIIQSAYKNYDAAATRADFAAILAGALPAEAVTPINTVTDGAIPDVYESFSYGPAVYRPPGGP
jgi:hypothetical protein